MKITLAASLLGTLAACGNDQDTGVFGVLSQTAGQVMADRRAPDQPAAPPKSAQDAAAEALRVNPGPLIQAGFESLGRTQVMAMTGQNGAMRTYMTPAEEALILRGGMLVGTRGLGNDLSVAEPATEGLIRAGAAGTGTRIMRYFAGDGIERPLQFTCTVGAGPAPA
ncbi:YjbF family lipoprotein [Paracoccus aerius]